MSFQVYPEDVIDGTVTLDDLAALAAFSVIGNETASSATPTAVKMVGIPGRDTTATAAGTTTLTNLSKGVQVFTGATTQTVTLPVVTTLPTLGFGYLIINDSTGAVTVNSSGANAVQVIAANSRAFITCILLTGTTAASWASTYTSNNLTIGPASSTDEAIARYDGTTGKLLQNSATTVSDTGVINIPENVSLQMGSQRAMEMQATALLIGTIAVNRPVYFYMGSVNVLRLMTSSGNLNSGPYQHTFGSAIGNQDVGIGRVAAGELKITDGSTGLGKIIVGGSTPASASATGTQGTITWDADYIYICTATNTWKRVAIATW